MPYTIKKRVKKSTPETPDIEEVRSLFSKVFEERRQAVLGALGVIAVIAILGVALTVYRSGRVKESTSMENQALTAFYEASGSPEEYERALELFQKADEVRSSALAQVYMAESYVKSGQPARAQEVYEKLVAREPDTPLASAARLKMALLAVGDGNREEALQELTALRKDTLVGDTALYHLSLIYEETGQSDNKLEVLKSLAAQFPKSPWAPEAIRYVEESSEAEADTAPEEDVGEESSGQ